MAEGLYAVVDESGDPVGLFDDLDEAIHAAGRMVGPGGDVVVDGTAAASYQPNPPADFSQLATPSRGAEIAFKASGLPVLTQGEVMAINLDDALGAVYPHFEKLKRHGEAVYEYPPRIAKYLLGDNDKLDKKDPKALAMMRLLGRNMNLLKMPKGYRAFGLSLMPNTIAFGDMTGRGKRTLCAGSNEECRSACLVYSGRNLSDPYNVELKLAKSHALLDEPVALARVLVESIKIHARRARSMGEVPFVRLNIFSDIPWELVFPDLFTRIYPDIGFYDYTKVSGRKVPENYDLTFSFSGTNEKLCRYEIGRGLRVAVVFLIKRRHRHEVPPLPKTFPFFAGLPVIDGDRHDLRPIDPAPSVVGLRYKPPKGGKAFVSRRFVVHCYRKTDVLTVALTPGQQPIVDADD